MSKIKLLCCYSVILYKTLCMADLFAETTTLHMALGCEGPIGVDSQAMKAFFVAGLLDIAKKPNDHGAAVVSQSILGELDATIKVYCQDHKCPDVHALIDKFNIYEIMNVGQSYYLFILKHEPFFNSLFQIENFKKRSFKQVTRLKKCDPAKSTNYPLLFKQLFSLGKKESINPIYINIAGHGSDLATDLFDELMMADTSLSVDRHLALQQEKIIDFIRRISPLQIQAITQDMDDKLIQAIFRQLGIQAQPAEMSFLKSFLRRFVAKERSLQFFKEDSLIADMDINSFSAVLDFLDRHVSVKALFLTTCFGGGLNSELPYITIESLNSPHLKRTYSFDIINASSETGEVAIDVNESFNNDMLKLIDIFSEPGFWKKNIERFLFSGDTFSQFYKYSSPMIRPKNQSQWFPLFHKNQLSTETLLLPFNITKILVDRYQQEHKQFIFTDPRNLIFVTTPCVTVPIILEAVNKDDIKRFTIRERRLFIDTLAMNMDNNFNYFINRDMSLLIKKLISLFIRPENLNDRISLDSFIGIKKLRFYLNDGRELIIEDVVLLETTTEIVCSFKHKYENNFIEIKYKKDYLKKLLIDSLDQIIQSPSTVTLEVKKNNPYVHSLEKKCLQGKTSLESLVKHLEERRKRLLQGSSVVLQPTFLDPVAEVLFHKIAACLGIE